MAADGRVIFEIVGDNSGIKKTMEQTTKTIETESKKWDEATGGTTKNFITEWVGALGAVVASNAAIAITEFLVNLGDGALNLASDLQDVQNQIEQTFGSTGATKIDQWADKAATKFGLAELEAKKYAESVGTMLKGAGVTGSELASMSTSIVGLAADMSALYGWDMDKAIDNITDGLKGSSKALQEIGVEVSKDNSVMQNWNNILEKTGDAQGYYAKNLDSYTASSQKVAAGMEALKAQIGEIMLPIATTIQDAIGSLLDLLVFGDEESILEEAAMGISDANQQAAEATGLLAYMEKLQKQYGDAATSTEEWKTALEGLKEVLPGVTDFINKETGELEASNKQLQDYVENTRLAAIEDAKKRALQSLTDQYTQASMDYGMAQVQAEKSTEIANQAVRNIIGYIQSKQGYENFTGEGMGIGQIEKMAYELAGDFGDSSDAIDDWMAVYQEHSDEAAAYTETMESAKAAMDSLESELSLATAALDKMTQAASGAASSLNTGGYFDVGGRWVSGKGFASGLDYVPTEGWYHLHQGERVQTAAEASLARMYGIQPPGLDYSTLGAAMWSNAPSMGGNVYLDGRTVGQVISQRQANSYRALQRSGWQA